MNTIPKHDCKEELHDVDLKVTSARLAVLSIMEESKIPLDVGSIRSRLVEQGIQTDKVTVFRMMNILSEKGLVRPIQFQEGKFRYEYGSLPDHHHFVCDRCGDIQDIYDCNVENMEKAIAKKKGVLVKRHSLEFFGLCANCLL